MIIELLHLLSAALDAKDNIKYPIPYQGSLRTKRSSNQELHEQIFRIIIIILNVRATPAEVSGLGRAGGGRT